MTFPNSACRARRATLAFVVSGVLLSAGCRDASDALESTAGAGALSPAGGRSGAGSAAAGAAANASNAGSGGSPQEAGGAPPLSPSEGGASASQSDAAAPSLGADAEAATGDARAPSTDPGDAFAPCPSDGSACAIMPFGDSITEGFPSFNGGYRVELFRLATLASRAITFVGVRTNGPANVEGSPFPPGHEGYSGFTIDPSTRSGISPRAEPAIATYQPHIILLMIGTNDIDLQIDVANAPARLAALIDRILTAAPDALLVVATILPTTNATTNERIRAYDAAIPALVEARQAAGKHVVGVDMYAAFTANPDFAAAYMVDVLHPNTAGYALLGQRFYETILPFLPAAP